jgi:hypothetical protein
MNESKARRLKAVVQTGYTKEVLDELGIDDSSSESEEQAV